MNLQLNLNRTRCRSVPFSDATIRTGQRHSGGTFSIGKPVANKLQDLYWLGLLLQIYFIQCSNSSIMVQ
ncbi:hypothetical protein O3M35_002247 [Rhynocoris fuscipes]|uniref:Uncharacterized protein n=1 Tax=Rhynocoris fuscipes TaxID=488301 RepID=A0AAW1CQH7_9HEMI